MVIPNLYPSSFAEDPSDVAELEPQASSDARPLFGAAMSPAAQGVSRTAPAAAPTASDAPGAPDALGVVVPGLGRRSVVAQQRLLGVLLAISLLALVSSAYYTLTRSDVVAQQLKAAGQLLMQSQRLAKSVTQVLAGKPQTFVDVAESAEVLTKTSSGLATGDESVRLKALADNLQPALAQALPRVERTQKNVDLILGQQKILQQIGLALRHINRQSEDLLELTKTVSSMKQQQSAAPGDISAVGELSTLTQRIGKSSNEFLTAEGASPEAVFLLAKDLNSFKEIAQGLLDGSADLRLNPTQDKPTRDKLAELIQMFEDTRTQAGAILNNLQGLVAVREAQLNIIKDSEPLRQELESLQTTLSSPSQTELAAAVVLAAATLLALLCAAGLAYVQLQDSRLRQSMAEAQGQEAQQRRSEAERLEQATKRVNDANQTAILRLMNELQTVAEGDLTQAATVTEDITGAIADSVNYTVEELRSLVSNVQSTADRVAQTTATVDNTSSALLLASNAQLQEIREAGHSVVEMAGRINDVSAQAQESALVARQSLQAAESGYNAVQNAIGGMNTIRDQIQETSKRLKRLGESSQEIGEITELISEITEQTNVLALNAAIQAASAGEAGRGFSVVAEEVQRLAERSADATRQIAALVKAIQTDTQDAIGAMERSAQGVVAGAKLSDNAGTALSEIDRVSRRMAEQIEKISDAALREAGLANGVADNIQHIFAVTEETVEGTRANASQVRELSRTSQELRQSVARFKIA